MPARPGRWSKRAAIPSQSTEDARDDRARSVRRHAEGKPSRPTRISIPTPARCTRSATRRTTPDTIRHVVVDTGRQGAPRRTDRGASTAPSIHDCMITKNYVIILDLPVTFSMKRCSPASASPTPGTKATRRASACCRAKARATTSSGATSTRATSSIPPTRFETPDGKVDPRRLRARHACSPKARKGPDSQRVRRSNAGRSTRRRKTRRPQGDRRTSPQEFPRPNEAPTGKPYRYAYTVALANENAFVGLGARASSSTTSKPARARSHDFGPGRMPGEFVFVAKANATRGR